VSFSGNAPLPAELAGVQYFFTDIDDTLTTEGRLLPQTYQALWDLSDSGIAVIPVTGGSAGWCEHIVRAWPVQAVIGESGAFVMFRDGKRLETLYWEDETLQRDRQRQHLHMVRELIDASSEGFELAHDQVFRLADVAIDIAGHRKASVEQLAAAIRAKGGSTAISSIHINTWIGKYNKRSMSERVLRNHFGVQPGDTDRITAFVGDSRNDAPMFGFIRNSFGVANIQPHLGDMADVPRWISTREAGLGFVDIAQAVLEARRVLA